MPQVNGMRHHDRGAAVAAWTVAVVATLSAGGFLVAVLLGRRSGVALTFDEALGAAVTYATLAVVCVVVGALIVTRRPENRIGWLLITLGVATGVGQALVTYAGLALFVYPGLSGAVLAGTLGDLVLTFGLNIPLVLLIFLFPTGHAHAPWSRRAARVSVTVLGIGALAQAIRPGTLVSLEGLDNPLGVGGTAGGLAAGATDVLFLAAPIAAAVAIVALVRRYRGAGPVERLQVRWFAYAVTMFVTGLAMSFALAASGQQGLADAIWPVVLLTGLFVPVAVGLSVLRYQLFEIDRLMSRTVSYGAIILVLGGVYLLGVLVLGQGLRMLGGGSGELAIAGSTLLVAALFRPVRERTQRMVMRRFDRGHYDAGRELEAFVGRQRQRIGLDETLEDIEATVTRIIAPTSVSVWMPATERA